MTDSSILWVGIFIRNGLVTAFAFVGLSVWISYCHLRKADQRKDPRVGHRHPPGSGPGLRGRGGHGRKPGPGRHRGAGRGRAFWAEP